MRGINKFAMKNIINFLLFQITWLVCVWSVGGGIPYCGMFFVLGSMIVHFGWISVQVKDDLGIIFKVILLGAIVETASVSLGLTTFKHAPTYLQTYPPYMWGLWANFAMTLYYSMYWLKGKYFLGSILGAVMGPLAYWGAGKLGAIQLHWDTPVKVVGFGAIWALAMFVIIKFFMRNDLALVDAREPIGILENRR